MSLDFPPMEMLCISIMTSLQSKDGQIFQLLEGELKTRCILISESLEGRSFIWCHSYIVRKRRRGRERHQKSYRGTTDHQQTTDDGVKPGGTNLEMTSPAATDKWTACRVADIGGWSLREEPFRPGSEELHHSWFWTGTEMRMEHLHLFPKLRLFPASKNLRIQLPADSTRFSFWTSVIID